MRTYLLIVSILLNLTAVYLFVDLNKQVQELQEAHVRANIF